jgi:hypothetical protein
MSNYQKNSLSNILKSKDQGYDSSKGLANQSTISAIQSATSALSSNREELEAFLLTKGLKLVTSLTEFLETSSFIKSSYIINLNDNDAKISYGEFLVKYPEFEKISFLIEKHNL